MMSKPCELSLEQQQRIEENKRRAKERLLRKRPRQPRTSLPTFSDPKVPLELAESHAKVGVPPRQRWHQTSGKWNASRGGSTVKDSSTPQEKKCVVTLQSRTRFKAISQYDSGLIDLYKKISSKAYGEAVLLDSVVCYLAVYFVFQSLYIVCFSCQMRPLTRGALALTIIMS